MSISTPQEYRDEQARADRLERLNDVGNRRLAVRQLQRMYGLLAVPGRWVPCDFALDANRMPCREDSSSARFLSLFGAGILATSLTDTADSIGNRTVVLLSKTLGADLSEWERAPGRTQADVLTLIQRAIAENGARS